jgi:proline iminopeptidase
MRTRYPAIEPYDSGMLAVGDGQSVYWEVSGNPEGKPVVFLHGGPGGGTAPFHRQFFDPAAYRIVLFDQRGCGRSTPHLADGASLEYNTTGHLISDIEALREHLGIDRWQVFGGSWGSTLALAYAQRHPDRVTEMVLRGIFLLRRKEIDWYYNGAAGYVYPDEWEKFLAPVPEDERDGDLVEVYHRLLHAPDEQLARTAAIAWSSWEGATSSLLPHPDRVAETSDPRFALAFARIENHYFRNGGFLDEGQLLRDIGAITHIPAVIVQGRHDIVCPAVSAWDLHRAWPGSVLHIVDDAGHAASEPGITHHLIEATDRFAKAGVRPVVTAGNALVAALREDIDRLLAAEPEVRADAPDSVHQMRVATRRLRSVLRSYGRLLTKKPAAAMGAELKWLAGLLGAARDAEVRADRFAELLTEHAERAGLDAVTERLVDTERDRYRAAHDEVLAALDGARYRELRDELSGWRTDPPLRHSRAAASATDVFGEVLRRDLDRVQSLVRAEATVDPLHRVELLHDIRKSAKRLRYACEAAEQVIGDEAAERGSRAKKLQTVLGDHRDAVESHEAILHRAAEAAAAGEDAGLYEILAAAEDAAAGRELSRYPATAATLFG